MGGALLFERVGIAWGYPREGFFSKKIMSIFSYIKETKGELSHVNWPTRRQSVVFSLVVIIVSILVAFFLGFFDFVFSTLLDRLIIR